MAERVSASITIGGTISAADHIGLLGLIAEEDLSIEWDGDLFEPAHRERGRSLSLYAHEVAMGRFAALETWCIANKLPFVTWSDGYPGQWGPQHTVFTGVGELTTYPTDEDGFVVLDRYKVEMLATFGEIIAYFDTADFRVPPLTVEGDELGEPGGPSIV